MLLLWWRQQWRQGRLLLLLMLLLLLLRLVFLLLLLRLGHCGLLVLLLRRRRRNRRGRQATVGDKGAQRDKGGACCNRLPSMGLLAIQLCDRSLNRCCKGGLAAARGCGHSRHLALLLARRRRPGR